MLVFNIIVVPFFLTLFLFRLIASPFRVAIYKASPPAVPMDPSQLPTSACYDCGINTPILLFTCTTRRLCCNCFLKQNKGTFCPICLELFEDSFHPNLQIMCLNCPSISHQSCVIPSTGKSAFVCPYCIDPNFNFRSVKAIVVAAQIASNSMKKALALARLNAEKNVVEAVIARNKVIEALEKFSNVDMKEEGSSTSK